MGNTLLPNNPTLDEIKDLIRRINSRIKIINASVNQEELTIDSPIATIIQSNSTDPGEYTTTDIDPTNFYTKNEINTLLQDKVNSTDLNTLLDAKQDTLEFDNTPTANSSNLVRSGGIKSYVDDMITNSNIVTTHTITWIGTNTSLIRQNIRKIGNIVFMQIVFSWTDLSSDEIIFTLPTELRPKYKVEGRFVSSNSNITINISIYENGQVIANSGNVTGVGNTRINIVYPVI